MRISDWSSDVCSSDLLFTFIGATTENPSFEVNSALLSRARVYVLQSLALEELQLLIERAIAILNQDGDPLQRSEEHTSELQSLMRISYAVFCLKKKKDKNKQTINIQQT